MRCAQPRYSGKQCCLLWCTSTLRWALIFQVPLFDYGKLVLVLWVKIMLIFYKGWRPYRKLAGPGHSWQPRWFPLQSRDSDDLGSYLADDGRRRRGFDAGNGPSNMPRLSGTCRFRNDCSLSWPLLKVRALTEREKPALGDLHAFPVEPTRSDLWAYPQGGKVAFEPPRRHTTCFIGPWWYLPDHFDGFFRKNFDPQMAEIDFFSHRVDPIYRFYVEGMPRFHASMIPGKHRTSYIL